MPNKTRSDLAFQFIDSLKDYVAGDSSLADIRDTHDNVNSDGAYALYFIKSVSDIWIETLTAKFYLGRPYAEQINRADIIHGLAGINRYGAHCIYPWSVAAHSLLMYHTLDTWMADGHIHLDVRERNAQDGRAKEDSLRPYNDFLSELKGLSYKDVFRQELLIAALVHDAAEIYFLDFMRPLKEFLRIVKQDIFLELQDILTDAIYEHFDCVPGEWQMKLLKLADLACLRTESRLLMTSKGEDWLFPLETPNARDDKFPVREYTFSYIKKLYEETLSAEC